MATLGEVTVPTMVQTELVDDVKVTALPEAPPVAESGIGTAGLGAGIGEADRLRGLAEVEALGDVRGGLEVGVAGLGGRDGAGAGADHGGFVARYGADGGRGGCERHRVAGGAPGGGQQHGA